MGHMFFQISLYFTGIFVKFAKESLPVQGFSLVRKAISLRKKIKQ